jgi:hypothetical protein
MSEDQSPVAMRPRPRFGIRLRVWLVTIGIVGVGVGLFSRWTMITPRLATVARIDKDDLWRIAWSPDRQTLAVLGWEKAVEVRDPILLAISTNPNLLINSNLTISYKSELLTLKMYIALICSHSILSILLFS